MTFYPSSTPLRAAVRPPIVPDGDITAVPGAAALATVVEEHADRLARNPFVGSWPVVIGDVVPVLRGDQLLVRDPDGTALPLLTSDVAPRLFAVSGGHPVTLVGEWDGNWLRPLAAFADGHLASVTTDAEGLDVKIDDPDWSALVSAALLGTERTGGNAPIPVSVAGLVAGAEAEQAILVAAGSMALRRRAGRTTSRYDSPLPPPAEPDPHPQLSGAAARYVGLGFDERPSLAPEVLELVRATGHRMPDEWLPDLMALARRADDASRLRRTWRDPRGVACSDTSGARRGRVVGDGGGLGRSLGGSTDRGGKGCGGSSHPSVGPASRPSGAGELVGIDPFGRAGARARSGRSAGRTGGRTLPGRGAHRSSSRRPPDRAGLLVLLPDSALTRRIEDEARPLLATGGRVRKSLKVTLPSPSEEFADLGFAGRPDAGYGERAWLLRPSSPTSVRSDGPSGSGGSVRRSSTRRHDLTRPARCWRDGSRRQRRFGDPAWAAAILRNPAVPNKVTINVGQVLDGLTPADARAVVAPRLPAFDPPTLAASWHRSRRHGRRRSPMRCSTSPSWSGGNSSRDPGSTSSYAPPRSACRPTEPTT